MIKDFNKVAIIAGEREISYTELLQRIEQYAEYTPKEEGAKTIIFSENCAEWVFAFFSVWRNMGIAVPVDASSTVDDLAYILKDCTPESIWCSEACEKVAREAIEAACSNANINIITEVKESSNCRVSQLSTLNPQPEKTALIIYTSGTTGSPKGVMLSYANLWANMAGVADEVPIFDGNRRTLMLLPVHHVLPLMGTVIVPIIKGCGIAICPSLSGPDIMDTLCRGKVGIFIGVPRLWQTLYLGIKKKIDANFITRTLFNICRKADSPALSRIVFSSIRKKMGGHIDYCVSGGAALDKEIGQGLRTLGLEVLEGYGMTETAPIISFTRPGDVIPGCVGLPLPSVECKIVDSEGNPAKEGELCARGANLMQGYYNRPEETAAVIDADGFIHTGDLARMDEKGRVYITGRSKEIIVLSNGKNVQPNEIEFKLEIYQKKVKEAAVMEDGDMLRAVIVPQELWARNLTDAEVEEALKREVIEPYNRTVENYKKLMRLTVFRGDLPRTKLDKLQRFKLKKLLEQMATSNQAQPLPIEGEMSGGQRGSAEFSILQKYIESEKKIAVRPSDHIETDLAFDSLDKVSLQGFIEQTFGMELKVDEMATYPNLRAMAEHIAAEKTRMEEGDVDWHSIIMSNSSGLTLPSTSPLYPLHAKSFKAFFKLYNRLEIRGAENIPAKGPFIIAPNHQSFLDGPIAVSALPWSTMLNSYFYATEEHVQHPLLRWMARRNNIILMEEKNLKNSIMKLAEVLKQGKNIIIFPEGARTHDGDVHDFKKMFAILSRELRVPIVPVVLSNAFDMMPRGSKFPKPTKVTVEYLPPVLPAETEDYADIAANIKTLIEQNL